MYPRAKSLGFIGCPCCQKLNSNTSHRCCRCHSILHLRKPHSVQYTLAWTFASLVMFLPANLYPIMVLHKFAITEPTTIFSGIIKLIQSGLYPIAAVVFIASFIIPFIKITGLLFLVYNTKRYSLIPTSMQSRFYRVVEWLGPWSMLDVFVVTIMMTLVNLGFIRSVEAAPGLNYFALMVIFTMFAVASFDTRLIWDIERRSTDAKAD